MKVRVRVRARVDHLVAVFKGRSISWITLVTLLWDGRDVDAE